MNKKTLFDGRKMTFNSEKGSGHFDINCAVIIDEHTSLPYCVIKSKNIVSDETLKGYAKQWIAEHSDCSWSDYRYVIMDIKDAPKIKREIYKDNFSTFASDFKTTSTINN